MVQLDDLRDLLEASLELLNLLEVVAKLDNWSCLEHPLLVDDKLTVFKRVDVALDEEKVGARLDRQETGTRDIDAMGILEVLDSCSGSSFELKKSVASAPMMLEIKFVTNLDDSLPVVGVLGVNDNLQLHSFSLHTTLESYKADVRLNSRYWIVGALPLRLIHKLLVLKILNLRTM
jgi:hypothetical protein